MPGCPTVALSHQHATGASKPAINQQLKALFSWDLFSHNMTMQLSLWDISLDLFLIQVVFKNRWTPFSNTSYLLVLILIIARRADIVVPPGDNIHSYYRTMLTKNSYAPGPINFAPGLKHLDTPVMPVTAKSAWLFWWCLCNTSNGWKVFEEELFIKLYLQLSK